VAEGSGGWALCASFFCSVFNRSALWGKCQIVGHAPEFAKDLVRRYLNSKGIRLVIVLIGPVPGWMTDDQAPHRNTECAKSMFPPTIRGT
jgi:hypothetical protein